MATDPKLPPQNIEAEQAVLGALLIDPEAIIKIGDKIKPEQFYRGSHQKIFAAMMSLFERREPADVLTVANELKESKDLDGVGGEAYLADLVNAVPSSANIESYTEIVKENAIRRTLISTASEMTKDSYETAKSIRELLQETEQAIFGISQENLSRTFVPIRDTLMESFDKLEELKKNKTGVRGVPTGFRDIDTKLSGLQDSSLIILAARPSVGKSSLALNISQYAAVHQKVPVGFFSLEMSRDELVNRLLASQSGVDSWKITTGNLNEEDFGKLGESMGILAEAPFYIDDTPGISISEMRTKARRLQLEHGVKLIVVDYLQLAVSRNLTNRVQEVAEISQGLKNIARELKCPVLALSQLSRGVEQRGEQRPQLSDLRDSGSIEQDADVAMFLWRPLDEEKQRPDHVKLTIAKNRNGATGEIDLIFKGEQTRFYSMEKKRQEG
ncbi:replicative DNA helicase [bacterium]|uniref:Replicative DNA helicase n=1 Tax=candidate division WWE3 bacterium CG22_combo_CG10-13_8_21_14_all_39_12 TaxID=1975094 RepID=A0A2H0BET3_UNCKA|nr:replicative DNA helicase [bacterium]PIP56124.1 MAG: replicative DNA helicase [candidate division WWE3 bacterium CG22_combo_CG10-13_8_21_14_all_39_12]